MTVKMLPINEFNAWVDSLIRKQTVIGPVEKDGFFVFEPTDQAADMRLDYDITILPPRSTCFPQKSCW